MQLDANFFKPFVDGAMKTFEISCKLKALPQKPFLKGSQPQPEFAIAGVIGLTSPKFNGNITLCFPAPVFLAAMSSMLGEDFKEITDDLQDGVAELLNIIYGQAKVVLNQQGHAVEKAIPSVIRGSQIRTTAVSSTPVMVLPFKTDAGEFHIEICSE
ncbi:MAG: hypothetical protein RJB38_1945 [Pseudomonadota bacterium]|jgi:chemotaxis protein CheX